MILLLLLECLIDISEVLIGVSCSIEILLLIVQLAQGKFANIAAALLVLWLLIRTEQSAEGRWFRRDLLVRQRGVDRSVQIWIDIHDIVTTLSAIISIIIQ